MCRSPHCHRRHVILQLRNSGFPVGARKDVADRIKDRAEYYATLMRYRYIISPPGNGLDNYRSWEALFLGRAVVLEATAVDPLFEDLPSLVVRHWENVTQEALDAKWTDLRRRKFNWQKLWMPFWHVAILRDMAGAK